MARKRKQTAEPSGRPTKKRTTGATQSDNGNVSPTANGASVEEVSQTPPA